MAFCPDCGTRLSDNTRFCPGCGREMAELGASLNDSQSTAKGAPGGIPEAIGTPPQETVQRVETTPTTASRKVFKAWVIVLLVVVVVSAVVGGVLAALWLGHGRMEVRLIYVAVGNTVTREAMDATAVNMRKRLDRLGVRGAKVTVVGTMHIYVLLPDSQDLERARNLIGQTAQLQFRVVQESKAKADAKDDPAWQITTGEDNLRPEKVIILPLKEGNTELMLKLGPTLLTGDAIKKAEVNYQLSNNPRIFFEMSPAHAKEFAAITSEYVNKKLALVLDHKVESAPTIREAITGGKGEITGNFTDKEAKDLAIVLETGALPVELKLMYAGRLR